VRLLSSVALVPFVMSIPLVLHRLPNSARGLAGLVLFLAALALALLAFLVGLWMSHDAELHSHAMNAGLTLWAFGLIVLGFAWVEMSIAGAGWQLVLVSILLFFVVSITPPSLLFRKQWIDYQRRQLN
jgi:hypothetical protein